MEPYIDPRLLKIIRAAGESGQVEAIIVANGNDVSPTVEDRVPLQKMVEDAIEDTGDHPISLRFFPRANAAVISASSRFIQAILQSQDLAVASATEIDLMVFSGS